MTIQDELNTLFQKAIDSLHDDHDIKVTKIKDLRCTYVNREDIASIYFKYGITNVTLPDIMIAVNDCESGNCEPRIYITNDDGGILIKILKGVEIDE